MTARKEWGQGMQRNDWRLKTRTFCSHQTEWEAALNQWGIWSIDRCFPVTWVSSPFFSLFSSFSLVVWSWKKEMLFSEMIPSSPRKSFSTLPRYTQRYRKLFTSIRQPINSTWPWFTFTTHSSEYLPRKPVKPGNKRFHGSSSLLPPNPREAASSSFRHTTAASASQHQHPSLTICTSSHFCCSSPITQSHRQTVTHTYTAFSGKTSSRLPSARIHLPSCSPFVSYIPFLCSSYSTSSFPMLPLLWTNTTSTRNRDQEPVGCCPSSQDRHELLPNREEEDWTPSFHHRRCLVSVDWHRTCHPFRLFPRFRAFWMRQESRDSRIRSTTQPGSAGSNSWTG